MAEQSEKRKAVYFGGFSLKWELGSFFLFGIGGIFFGHVLKRSRIRSFLEIEASASLKASKNFSEPRVEPVHAGINEAMGQKDRVPQKKQFGHSEKSTKTGNIDPSTVRWFSFWPTSPGFGLEGPFLVEEFDGTLTKKRNQAKLPEAKKEIIRLKHKQNKTLQYQTKQSKRKQNTTISNQTKQKKTKQISNNQHRPAVLRWNLKDNGSIEAGNHFWRGSGVVHCFFLGVWMWDKTQVVWIEVVYWHFRWNFVFLDCDFWFHPVVSCKLLQERWFDWKTAKKV